MLKEFPDDSFLMHAKALELIKTNAHQTAKDTFVALLEKNPDYVGSYYHLAQLLTTMGDTTKAAHYFEKGMAVAKKLNDRHAYNELQAAYDDLML